MANELLVTGLFFIFLGWVIQLYYSRQRKIFALSLKFVAFFVFGVILLAIDSLKKGMMGPLIINSAITLVAALAGYFAKKARP